MKKGVAKVPVVMQMEALECGAACLAMVMAYYRKWVPLEQVRVDCGMSRDGSKAKNIVLAAPNHGFEVSAYSISSGALRKDAVCPCIIHWNFNHFVVLCGVKGDQAIISAPARGTVKVTKEQLDEAFTGVYLEFTPGYSFVPSGKPRNTLNFYPAAAPGHGPRHGLCDADHDDQFPVRPH
ncbi:MAG: hypothetical protein IKH57_01860 [Clostridia bacterium]|nr:hypothetical protein [Clostridia bacterium]